MPHTLAEIEQQARDLPAQARARLALAHIQYLESTDEGDIEEAWRAEVEARWASIQRGTVRQRPSNLLKSLLKSAERCGESAAVSLRSTHVNSAGQPCFTTGSIRKSAEEARPAWLSGRFAR